MAEHDIDSTVMVEHAKQKYPYLKDKSFGFTLTPNPNEARQLEYWPAGEIGSQQSPRPSSLPLEQGGMQVFNPNIKAEDILGDYVSHEAINTDPRLKAMYAEFQSLVPDTTMQDRYTTHQKRYGEDRPFDVWKEHTGMPEYFRGHTFNQWTNPQEIYTPEQLQKLNEVKQYLGVPNRE